MKSKTKELALTGILTAIAIIIPLVVPVRVVSFPFTATLAAHVPLIMAMFMSPLSAVIVALGSAVGFLISLGPIVAARAAMHIFFVFAGAVMIKKRRNIFAVIIVTVILHSLSDMAIVYILYQFGVDLLNGQAMTAVQLIIAIGTTLHHIVDFVLAIIILMSVEKAFKDVFVPIEYLLKKRGDA